MDSRLTITGSIKAQSMRYAVSKAMAKAEHKHPDAIFGVARVNKSDDDGWYSYKIDGHYE